MRPRSLEELEEQKRARLDGWEQSLSSQELKANANFAPVKGDWRARVARKS